MQKEIHPWRITEVLTPAAMEGGITLTVVIPDATDAARLLQGLRDGSLSSQNENSYAITFRDDLSLNTFLKSYNAQQAKCIQSKIDTSSAATVLQDIQKKYSRETQTLHAMQTKFEKLYADDDNFLDNPHLIQTAQKKVDAQKAKIMSLTTTMNESRFKWVEDKQKELETLKSKPTENRENVKTLEQDVASLLDTEELIRIHNVSRSAITYVEELELNDPEEYLKITSALKIISACSQRDYQKLPAEIPLTDPLKKLQKRAYQALAPISLVQTSEKNPVTKLLIIIYATVEHLFHKIGILLFGKETKFTEKEKLAEAQQETTKGPSSAAIAFGSLGETTATHVRSTIDSTSSSENKSNVPADATPTASLESENPETPSVTETSGGRKTPYP